MKGKYIVKILCGCVLFLMTGCGAQTEGKAPSENPVEDVSLEENVQDENNSDEELIEKPAVDNDFYEELIDAAERCIREEDYEASEAYGFSVIIYMGRNSETLGYRIEDIDGNGIEELIFGENWGEHTVIYDIYTIFEGELVHVLDGWDRNRYYLCENGMIANEGSGGAAHSNYAYFTFDGVELHLAEAVIYDGDKDRENPWFYSVESEYDAEYAEPISGERAAEIINQYVYCDRTFIPFIKDN